MRWFWQRRRKPQPVVEAPAPVVAPVASVLQRAPTTTGRLGQPRELTDELLLLARDYYLAAGGKVRVEEEDVLSASLPDGSLIRYTTTLAKARADESMTLLVDGSEALATMLEAIAARSRRTALRLAAASDPIALALDSCATPAAGCGRCLEPAGASDAGYRTLCETCPRRAGRIVLRWRTSGTLIAHVVQQEQRVSVELAYLIVAREHQGRRDEWMRHAMDCVTGKAIPVLSTTALAAAQAERLPVEYERLLTEACASAERALSESLSATGVFLRQRSLDEYRHRQEEVATTFDRLQHESPETARAAKAGRRRELSALSEVYAVDVEAQLESACFVASPYATVALRLHGAHGEVLLHVDLGRQVVLAPDCAACGASAQTGLVCEKGHILCPECAVACRHCGSWRCAACGEGAEAHCVTCGQPAETLPASTASDSKNDDAGIFAVKQLEALPPEMWLTAIEWILSCQEITIASRRLTEELGLWQGQSERGKLLIAAVRPDRRLALDETALRQTAAHLGQEQPATTRMIFATAPATVGAQQVAQQLGVQLVDRPALETLLAGLASAHDNERTRQLDETQMRADAACVARQVMLAAIDAEEHALSPLKRSRRTAAAAMAQTGVAAMRALAQARTAIERASLAWETLLADWAASFGEHPARNGSLVIQAASGDYTDMAERASHLQAALLDATALLAATPAQGEAGFTTWRQAILDEVAARCESWRWRIRTFDPAAWNHFERAWNAKAAAKAAEATIAAGHATARADKAQSQAQRAG